ncbi:uncharacterized protein [Dermacentor albipictus]|uniref:uncharacterized protein n=1 Tax=Dermacentor albipictus TaxID=60249 RepID=UPI0038FD2D03
MMVHWHMGIARPLGVLFLLAASLLGPSFSCNTKLPPLGPRLLSAKALFGEVMRVCKNHILAYAKTMAPDKVHRIIFAFCTHYNTCKSFARNGAPEVVYNCTLQVFRKQLIPNVTSLHTSEAYVEASQKALECLWKVYRTHPLDIQAMDDAIAVGRQAVLTFGWT